MAITHMVTDDGVVWFPARGVELDVEHWDTTKVYLRMFSRADEHGRRQVCWVVLYWNNGWTPLRLWVV